VGSAPQGYVNLAEKIDHFPNSIHRPHILFKVKMDCFISIPLAQQAYLKLLFSPIAAGHWLMELMGISLI
jgi:hypothetical protein